MGEIEELELSLAQVSDEQLINVLVDLSDELTSRAARDGEGATRYQQAAFLVDLATQQLSIREEE